MAVCRVGLGYDIHKLVPGRRLLLGGVAIESDVGLDGHSDADALLHSITDAILGACGEPDIGEIFPSSDDKWKGASSVIFVNEAVQRASQKNLAIQNVDSVIIAERPKLRPWKESIRRNIAEILGIGIDCVGIKAKSSEGMGPVGEGKAIEARTVVLLSSRV
ncbi:2-C-methyl-D-erythritol 2,4-cyclodiphosphate synthase-like [Corticium candelabrum]|uniref:2-C-methyl-D-erythritol 2,4-cyclodiphosphate synthase-like n=1 Tax=Corticium candelabrum TaxID=121492 RepID=UPI002E25C6FC|nr:2-C-methyl-D-erythritol 2,4-cyclodiphosphate synthase-like [Corticium candelabrum]